MKYKDKSHKIAQFPVQMQPPVSPPHAIVTQQNIMISRNVCMSATKRPRHLGAPRWCNSVTCKFGDSHESYRNLTLYPAELLMNLAGIYNDYNPPLLIITTRRNFDFHNFGNREECSRDALYAHNKIFVFACTFVFIRICEEKQENT